MLRSTPTFLRAVHIQSQRIEFQSLLGIRVETVATHRTCKLPLMNGGEQQYRSLEFQQVVYLFYFFI